MGGTISFLKKEDIDKLRIKDLVERIKNPQNFGTFGVKEVILALNPTTEGESTSLYLQRVLANEQIKITRLARGLPTGAELEYADDETLKSAFQRRV